MTGGRRRDRAVDRQFAGACLAADHARQRPRADLRAARRHQFRSRRDLHARRLSRLHRLAGRRTGRDSADKFKGLVTSQGGTIAKTLFTPFGTPDFGAKISELGAEPADGLFVTIFGSDAINLAKQQQQFGLFKKYKMVLGNSFVIPQTLPAQGDTVLGVYQNIGFVAGFPGAQAEAFVKAYSEKYNGELPPYTGADQYAAIELIAAALNKANSTDINAVRAALSGLKADTVLGDVEMRAGDHQAVRRMAISQILPGKDGKPTYHIKKIEPGPDIIPPVDPACKK
ncbi:ABC transporter substrate-binding protein [Bradyrhizobium sp. AUGA SZCCT0160]|nr:ABC transporter substrate-binding protein [Bradyrhizobium sp. AUGA SZCCT0160]